MSEAAEASFSLSYLWCEDEAEMTGYRFTVEGDQVRVQCTFAYPEYEEYAAPKFMSKPEAREFWRSCLESGNFERIN